MVIWGNVWTWFRLAKPMKWGSYEVPIMHLPICLYVFLRFFLWNGMLNFLSSWMKWKYSKKQQLDFWGKSFILSKCNQNEMGIFVFFFFFFFFFGLNFFFFLNFLFFFFFFFLLALNDFFLKNIVLRFTGLKGAQNAPKMSFFRFYEKLKFGIFLFFLCVKLQQHKYLKLT